MTAKIVPVETLESWLLRQIAKSEIQHAKGRKKVGDMRFAAHGGKLTAYKRVLDLLAKHKHWGELNFKNEN